MSIWWWEGQAKKMPIYCYKCSICQKITEDFLPVPEPRPSIPCQWCGSPSAERSLSSEHFSTDCVHNERWSEAMGVAPNQVDEARRTFPGSVYDDSGRLRIDSRKHKIQEMKRRGYSER